MDKSNDLLATVPMSCKFEDPKFGWTGSIQPYLKLEVSDGQKLKYFLKHSLSHY